MHLLFTISACDAALDIMFVVDNSDMDPRTYGLDVRDYMVRFIRQLSIGRGRVRVGLIQYNDRAETIMAIDRVRKLLFMIKI